MGDGDLKQIARDAAGFYGTSFTADNDYSAPAARMLNAVPALLAEVERLRNLGRSACVLATLAPGKAQRARELLAEINRKPSKEATNG
jgi:hypothetical protein